MKKILFLLALVFSSFLAGQDIGVTQITSPVTGCALTSTENVVVKIFNYGSNMSGIPFDVSYTVNGGPAQTDANVIFASFLTNSTVTYTVSIPANLSAPGTYTLTATATVAGDINTTNDFISGYTVTNTAPSVGGAISGDTNVCVTSNSGLLTLAGYTGNIVNWEYSTDGSTWFTLSNTSNTQPYSNVTVQTDYRVKVLNPGCTEAYSDTATLTIDPATVGGTVAGTATRCTGSNSGTLTLSGNVGSVQYWEFSINGGATWSPIANTTNSQSYLNLTQTTRYRAVVKSGACISANSTQGIITISPLSVGGNISGDDTVCAGSNTGVLTLSGQTGSILWQISTNNGASFTNVVPANTTTSLTYNNLNDTTYYRVRITSGACAAAFSDTAIIVVNPATVPGTVSTSTTVCSGTNTDTLYLSGESGTIVDWEFSTDGGSSWTGTGDTDTAHVFTNLTTNTLYHAIVQAAGCASAASTAATVTVNNPSVGGTVATNTTVCATSNSGTLTLSGQTGTVQNWFSSDDGGATWDTIVNTTTSQAFNNLTDTTIYIAVVANGVCPADTSDTVTVFVDQPTIGGTVLSNSTVCYGNNADTLTLTGNNGSVLSWEFSNDGGVTWISVSNTTTSQAFSNITANTTYRAIVQNGSCPSEFSSSATISVSPVAIGGTVYGGTTVCSSGNTGTLTLVGYSSSVVQWEASVDSGVTWTPIVNTTAFENFSNLSQTTWFQAIVGSGVCPNDTSSIATVFVDTMSVGGIVSMSDTVCAGQNGDTLALTGNIGTVNGWQMSTDGGATWISLANSGLTQSYSNLNTTTMFRTEVKNGVCAPATSTAAIITVDQASEAGTISSAATVCETYNGGTLTLSGTNGTILGWESSTDGGATWTAIANTTNQQTYANLTDTTWYRAIAISGVCVADTGSPVTITVIPKPNVQFSAIDTCFGVATTFSNTTTVQAGYIQLYTWDFGDNTGATAGSPVHMYADTGTYNVTLVALSNFGCLDTNNISVAVYGLPSVAFTTSGPLQFCSGDSVTISVPSIATNIYAWNTGDSISSITVDTAGTWTVMVTDTLTGCFNSDSLATVIYITPTVNAGVDDTISLGNSITLAGSSNGATFSWSPSATLDISTILNPVATPTTTTTYSLVVTSLNGCTATDSVTITVEQGYEFVINTVITPNGDGFNDVWYIKNLTFYPNNEVIIFNRYGQKVFGMSGYDNSWDGTFGGNAVPDGTYYYVLKFSDSDENFTGAITVLRGSK